MFKFVAFAIWIYLAYLIPLRKPSHSMTEAEKICFTFKNAILTTVWYAANLIYIAGYKIYLLNRNQSTCSFVMNLCMFVYVIYFAMYIAIEEIIDSSPLHLSQIRGDFFKNCRNKDFEKFSYKLVKQFYIFHPESFRLSIYNFFVCSFIYKDKETCLPKEGLFRMSVIDYIRFVLFVKHCQEKEERKIDKNKEMKEAMISLLEEDRKRIAEDEALAREEFLAARKDNGVIVARLTGQ